MINIYYHSADYVENIYFCALLVYCLIFNFLIMEDIYFFILVLQVVNLFVSCLILKSFCDEQNKKVLEER